MAADVQGLEMGGVFIAEASSESPQVMPACVSVQDPAFGGIGAGMNCRGDPALQRDKAFVAGGSAPVATMTLRRCARTLLAGSSSSVSCVTGRSSRPICWSRMLTFEPDSQNMVLVGRSAPDSAS
ncbi:hypothetical protein [Streptomyces sp. P9-A2]|uniref:hypothetical protein n=1 Tax=Streptomyces sp. P9-A2 TaxID=3072284 RepID=UPI002FC8D69E